MHRLKKRADFGKKIKSFDKLKKKASAERQIKKVCETGKRERERETERQRQIETETDRDRESVEVKKVPSFFKRVSFNSERG